MAMAYALVFQGKNHRINANVFATQRAGLWCPWFSQEPVHVQVICHRLCWSYSIVQENQGSVSETTPQPPLLSRILKFFSDEGGKDRVSQARLFFIHPVQIWLLCLNARACSTRSAETRDLSLWGELQVQA